MSISQDILDLMTRRRRMKRRMPELNRPVTATAVRSNFATQSCVVPLDAPAKVNGFTFAFDVIFTSATPGSGNILADDYGEMQLTVSAGYLTFAYLSDFNGNNTACGLAWAKLPKNVRVRMAICLWRDHPSIGSAVFVNGDCVSAGAMTRSDVDAPLFGDAVVLSANNPLTNYRGFDRLTYYLGNAPTEGGVLQKIGN